MNYWKSPSVWSTFFLAFSAVSLLTGIFLPHGTIRSQFGTTYVFVTDLIPFLIPIIKLSWTVGLLLSLGGIVYSLYSRDKKMILASAILLVLGLIGLYTGINYIEIVANSTTSLE